MDEKASKADDWWASEDTPVQTASSLAFLIDGCMAEHRIMKYVCML